MARVEWVAVVGGPGGGKSSAIAEAAWKLPEYGVPTVWVPEAASMLHDQKIPIPDTRDREKFVAFERRVIEMVLDLERRAEGDAAAYPDERVAGFSDRGAPDIKEYLREEEFGRILGEIGVTERELFNRYRAAIYLVSAADGAAEFYNLDNPARHENLEKALEQERKALSVWKAHANLYVIPNVTEHDGRKRRIGFAEKKNLFLRALCRHFRIPAPLGRMEKKFLLIPHLDLERFKPPGAYEAFESYTARLCPARSGRVRMVCERRQKKLPVPELFVFQEGDAGRVIDRRTYSELLKNERDMNRPGIALRTQTFRWRNQYCRLDEIKSPRFKKINGMTLLSVEPTEENRVFEYPDPYQNFYRRDVSGDPNFSEEAIATGACPGYAI